MPTEANRVHKVNMFSRLTEVLIRHIACGVAYLLIIDESSTADL
jgi:hypothetical protein